MVRILGDAEIREHRLIANLSCRQPNYVGRVAYPTMTNDDPAIYLRVIEIPTATERSPGIDFRLAKGIPLPVRCSLQ